ncbi:MAG: sporulation protein YhbH [Chloroflexi bacterium]|nr:sporulation protein YhbH [Chloroflexota bacterium]
MNSGVWFSVSKSDWSLHRKGPMDEARHKEKVKEAIKDNLAEIISEEAIITSDGSKRIKVPIRSLELPRFRYNFRDKERVGQGTGDTQAGDVIGHASDEAGPGTGKGAGDQPGIDYYEAEITVDELAEMMFKDFGLPYLKPKATREIVSEEVKFQEVRKRGIMTNLDKRRTVYQGILRRARQGDATFQDIKDEDLRFRTWTPEVKKESNAVVIAMRDVSGSMGEFEKYITRTFYFWMVRFLRTKYQNVDIVFLTHHTEAKEVDEETFFKLGESGGTMISSAYKMALEIIQQRYPPELWNIYPFHFSDGENWSETDNKLCVELVKKLTQMCNIFGYGEIQRPGYGQSALMTAFTSAGEEHLVAVAIRGATDVYPALQRFFSLSGGDHSG